MLQVKKEGIILEKTNLPFENQAVFNPSCVEVDGITHMYYRAVRKPDMVSSIGYCQLKDNQVVERWQKPLLAPEKEYEKAGIEDPRIVFFEGRYYLFYTAFDGKNALIAYATSNDSVNFTKQGIISARMSYRQAARYFSLAKLSDHYSFFVSLYEKRFGSGILLWEKDAFLLPKRIKGKMALMHRILPGIQVIYFDNFDDLKDASFWRHYLKELNKYQVLDPQFNFESWNIGGGCPAVETADGWLLIYHGSVMINQGKFYHAGAALLDLDDPTKVIGRLPYPLFSPEETWEKTGDVNNVVFPTGAVVKKGRLYIYYGAADKLVACRSVKLKELLDELKSHPPKGRKN